MTAKSDTGALKLKIPQFTFNSKDPFKSDLLNRKEEILNLSSLVQNVNSPAVIAINSRWGTGKTTFIRLWKEHLKKEGAPSLYFNAWDTDFSEDPLVSFLGEMEEGLKSFNASGETNETWEKTKAAGKQVIKRSVPALIRAGTAGILDTGKIAEEIANVSSLLAGDALDSYIQQKDAISEFRSTLSEFVKNSTDGEQLIIFVDELDRCRPNYAIELLERIKHLFNIKGLVFVLALDKEQLGHSIKAVYGNGMDSDGYLRRFIDFEYQLKKPDVRDYIESLFLSFQLGAFFDARERYPGFRAERENLTDVFVMLASGCRLSLRQIEQFLASINIAIRTVEEKVHIFPALLVFLMLSKHFKPEAYQRYISDEGDESELIEYLYEIVPKNNRSENYACALVESFLIAANRKRGNESTVVYDRHRKITQDEALSDEEKKYSIWVMRLVKDHMDAYYTVTLKTLSERIEWIRRFDFLDDKNPSKDD